MANEKDLRLLRKNRNILMEVAADLREIWWPARTINDSALPLIALDWSELFTYAAALPPSSNDIPPAYSVDSSALHYAGLTCLFFKIPCRLLLLPPYIWEMRNYLDLVRMGVLVDHVGHRAQFPLSRFKKLTAELRDLEQKYPRLSEIIAGSEVTVGDREILVSLREVVEDDIPNLFFRLQEATLEFVESLRNILYTNPGRVITLADLDLPAEAVALPPEHWLFWLRYMKYERDKPRQNERDAQALAFLEKLCQISHWGGRSVLFATRSAAMFSAMGKQPGSFPSNPSLSLTAGTHGISCARSWEYFAEVGFFLQRPDLEASLQEISRRIAYIDLQLSRLEEDQEVQVDSEAMRSLRALGSSWESIRGEFNLDGIGMQKNWERVAKSDNSSLLVGVVRSLLGGSSSKLLAEERNRLAGKIFHEIDAVLASFPRPAFVDEMLSSQKKGSRRLVASGLFRAVDCLALLDLEAELSKVLPMPVASNVSKVLARPVANTKAEADAREWLGRVANTTPDLDTSTALWIAASVSYYQGNHEEVFGFLGNWLQLRGSRIAAGPALIAAAIQAESARNPRGRKGPKLREAFGLLDRQLKIVEKSSGQYLLVWHNLRLRFVLDWLDYFQEIFDNFPNYSDDQPEGRTGSIAEHVLEAAIEFHAKPGSADIKGLDTAYSNFTITSLLFGIARCLRPSEDAPAWVMKHAEVTFRWVKVLENQEFNEKDGYLGAEANYILGYLLKKVSRLRPLSRAALAKAAGDSSLDNKISLESQARSYLGRALELAENGGFVEVSEWARTLIKEMKDEQLT